MRTSGCLFGDHLPLEQTQYHPWTIQKILERESVEETCLRSWGSEATLFDRRGARREASWARWVSSRGVRGASETKRPAAFGGGRKVRDGRAGACRDARKVRAHGPSPGEVAPRGWVRDPWGFE